jgi:hypothetical protein
MDINNGIAPVVDTFVRTVWTELAPIFPGEYLHIGGDEVSNASQTAYAVFVKRLEQIIHGLGKKMTGWEELFGIASDQRVQAWQQGSDQPGTIFSWCSKMYWDENNRSGDTGTNSWCVSQITLQDVFAASSQVSSPNPHAGVEGCFWGDKIIAANVDRQLFPRTAAVADIGWTTSTNWNGFKNRVSSFSVRFNLMGISWYTGENLVTWETGYTQFRDSSDISVFSGFMPAPVPIDTIRESFIIAHNFLRSPALAFAAHYRIFDLRGRMICVSDGRGLKDAVRYRISTGGVYFIAEERRRNAHVVVLPGAVVPK